MHYSSENPPSDLLKFNKGGNAKLQKEVMTFSLPSGYSCPGAKHCLAKVDIDTGKIVDGPEQKFRCFSATNELRPSVRAQRWHNYTLLTQLKTAPEMADLIIRSFPRKCKTMRIHVGGDFYSQAYFDAWLTVAKKFPACLFYAYTKSIPFVKAREALIPDNLKITLSLGGKFDYMISDYSNEFGIAEVVKHPEDATAKGIPIDHDDSHAQKGKQKFALLLHSAQPQNSDAAQALRRMREEEINYSYSHDV